MSTNSLDAIHARMVLISKMATWFGGASILILSILITAEVILRKYFDFSLEGVQELSTYAFAGATSLAMSHCLLRRANVRIDTLYNLVPKPVAAFLDVIGTAILFYVMSIVTFYCVGVFRDSWDRNSMPISGIALPLWVPQFFWAAGFVLFLLTIGFVLFYCLVAMARRNWALVAKVAGIPSVEETVEDDIRVEV